MKTSILFLLENIGDLPEFKAHRSNWDVIVAPNTEHALQALGDGDYEAVIADVKYQTNNDIPFFSRVINRSPNSTRILLCPPSPEEAVPTMTSRLS